MSGASPLTLPRSRTASPKRFVFTLWTADLVLARAADQAGIDRIGVDLERLGKAERQRGRGTWLSPHTEHDLVAIAKTLTRAIPFARLNPMHAGTRREVEVAIAAGARVVMLPMIVESSHAERFVEYVGGRARIVLLVEHVDGLRNLGRLVDVSGIDEIHIGLNDLALSLGLANRWLTLGDDLLVSAGEITRAAGLRFGLGGIGRVHDANLPIPSDLVYAQYARTGATAALISRSFFGTNWDCPGLAKEISRSRACLASWYRRGPEALERARAGLVRSARATPSW